MYLLSIAAERPERVLESSYLAGLNPEQALGNAESSGLAEVLTRRTVLPLEYISSTLNQSPREAVECAEETPTDLAAKAARKVLVEAGVKADQVGLVIGGSATPLQTIPSEAQRVAGALGMKTNAYDINGSSGDLTLMLSNLLKWKDDRLPDYILCVSTNTPTTRLDYSKGVERFIFSDGAVALLLSPRIKGKSSIRSADYRVSPGRAGKTRVEIYGHLRIDDDQFFDYVATQQEEMLRTVIQMEDVGTEALTFIDNHYPFSIRENLYNIGIQPEKHFSQMSEIGCVLSTGPFITLADRLGDCLSGESVLVSAAGLGAGTGYVFMRME